MTEEYYLQNKDAGYLGNAPTWWAKGGKGYTAYILGAERFTREAAQKYVTQDPEKFAMYKCADIDARLHMVFDSQDFKNLGTDAPCGWASGYAPALNPTDPSQHLPEKLPCDVTIGASTFRRGVPTSFVLDKINWWQEQVDQGEVPPENRPARHTDAQRQEEKTCTCGAAGSGEGHTDWCDWLDVESPAVPQHVIEHGDSLDEFKSSVGIAVEACEKLAAIRDCDEPHQGNGQLKASALRQASSSLRYFANTVSSPNRNDLPCETCKGNAEQRQAALDAHRRLVKSLAEAHKRHPAENIKDAAIVEAALRAPAAVPQDNLDGAIALIKAAEHTFKYYAENHRAKNPPDEQKAIRNDMEAAAMRKALALLGGKEG